MQLPTVFDQLSQQGFRLTKARKALLRIFFAIETPISAKEIKKELQQNNITVNKSTVYRELDFLLKQNIITEVNLNTSTTYYERAALPHHHHLVCNDCGQIKDINSQHLEQAMHQLIHQIEETGFTIKDHDIELYGQCTNCQ